MAHSITVLLHHRDPYPKNKKSYLLWYVVDCWKALGIEVHVIKGPSRKSLNCDLLLPHIDTTIIPPEYLKYIKRHPRVLNRQVNDISKRRISRNLLSAKVVFNGPVIVKTNNNYGGLLDMQNEETGKNFVDRLSHLFRNGTRPHKHPYSYTVYESKSEVREEDWCNADLVIEKFIPERRDEYYCIRICHFLGDIALNNKVFSKSKIIKGNNVEFIEPAEIPPSLMQIRKDLGFDYGKFDYVMHDGEVHLLDANKTPGSVSSDAINTRVAHKLASGIAQFLKMESF